MRSEREMMDLIIETAEKDDRIRAVYMNGSRTNPRAPRDLFQDYDIAYVVKETASFLADEEWISVFGDRIMMQEPDKLDQIIGQKVSIEESYAYLMLFSDGNRIDLTLKTANRAIGEYTGDSLTIPLLDKDGILPDIQPANDYDYHVKKPTEAHYFGSCNEFWWVSQNVAKGLWRDELPYGKAMFERYVRAKLDEMASWWIGMHHDFNVSPGKLGKYFKKYLPEIYWTLYKKTYADSHSASTWDALFSAVELFRTLGKDVAIEHGFTYKTEDDQNMTRYLTAVRSLPADAEAFTEEIKR
ncbi:aminoglycoside 6-adenylyltransferase [Fictibacillus aquaticus]|uniref:Aminoglycoside adenylyltransferase n=1 Tax=Fictibacillus aquaticus TaxID=2021314 RepID=A0A235FDE7_9BACL|nr:aminoglycoside 6-adenylyltransferase [Fictibacillus aquaticus]OYD59430.1 aminoglycoside adenylyltransferase [Fictibacillus aquaticus]